MAESRLRRLTWNAQRFGLTPAKLKSRFAGGQGPRVLSNSLPKAGTHLLERALCLHPRLYRSPRRTLHDRRVPSMGDLSELLPRLRPGELLVTHLSHNSERQRAVAENDVASLFLIRDPRDIVVSQSHYVVGRAKHPHHETLSQVDDFQERLRRVITGDAARGMGSMRARLESYAGWLAGEALVLRYEDLIGASGGGSADTQMETLSRVFDHIGVEMSASELDEIAEETFSAASPTFRRGRIEQWREQFDGDTAELFEREVGDLAELYGYGSHVPPRAE